MNRLAINTVGDELEAAAEFCRAEQLGLEVTAFATTRHLDGDFAALVERHRRAVDGVPFVSVHGPFIDLVASSPDPEIVAVCRRRHGKALEAARELGASYYIAHTCFNPMIRDARYHPIWSTGLLDFWLPLADEAGRDGLTICLENLWEPHPELPAALIRAGAHPHLRASFDNGHALVFSEHSASRWIEVLGDCLAHLHLHDNHGEADEHAPIGDGIEDWPALVGAARSLAPDAVLVIESEKLQKNELSLGRLRAL